MPRELRGGARDGRFARQRRVQVKCGHCRRLVAELHGGDELTYFWTAVGTGNIGAGGNQERARCPKFPTRCRGEWIWTWEQLEAAWRTGRPVLTATGLELA